MRSLGRRRTPNYYRGAGAENQWEGAAGGGYNWGGITRDPDYGKNRRAGKAAKDCKALLISKMEQGRGGGGDSGLAMRAPTLATLPSVT